MSRPSFLFSDGDLSATLRSQEEKVEGAAQDIPADHAVANSAEDLAAALVEEFRIDPIALDEGAMTVSSRDEQIDVSRDPMRFIRDPSRPFYVPGTTVTYHVPFGGAAGLFKLRPSRFTSNPPSGFVGDGELRISESVPTPVPADIKAQLDRNLAQVKTYLDWVNADVTAFNARLAGSALAAATRRREKVKADHDLVASFGIPVRRADAPTTYAAPPVHRQISRAAAAKGAPGAKLEPVLPAEEYEHILSIVGNMAKVMERSPKAFATMGEEDLRQHFLVQLNGQYEGDATGETFNFEGKTDILIRRDGRNIFIAECKFWDGPKKVTDTIDQLLGYSSWRDTKTAVFIFNRGGNLTNILTKIGPTVVAHPNFVREISYGGETDFRFILRHRDDPERELTLTIRVFEVPG
jgi:hypothetical protein